MTTTVDFSTQRQQNTEPNPRLVNAAVRSACWRCRGEQLSEQDGAARFALCDLHLQQRIRALMGLQ